MSTLLDELTTLKTDEDRITGNKVANFAYDDYAYENNDANGVDTYNVNNHQNIPNATASVMKVNSTVLNKGWRAQASAITRMLMNHFLGRCSYNLNKINDYFSTLLAKLIAYIGQPDGLATLDSNGKVALLNNVENTGDSATPAENGTDKFTTGGAYDLMQALETLIDGKAPTNHASSSDIYGKATTTLYGHVKRAGSGLQVVLASGDDSSYRISVESNLTILVNDTAGTHTFNLIGGIMPVDTYTVSALSIVNGSISYSSLTFSYDMWQGGYIYSIDDAPAGAVYMLFRNVNGGLVSLS